MVRESVDPKISWFITNNNYLQSSTVSLIFCLIPKEPFGENCYLMLSGLLFTFFAVLNHCFPYHLSKLTHVVKASFTHLLAASIGLSLHWALLISLMDLLPIILSGKRVAKWIEDIGAYFRLGMIFFGFYLIDFNPVVIFIFVICNILYFRERKNRIKKGERHNYGPTHAFEHVALLVYLFAVNYNELNLPVVYLSLTIYLVGAWAFTAFVVLVFNLLAYANSHKNLPNWFDPELIPAFQKKLKCNVKSTKFFNYLFKPYAYSLSNEVIQWEDIEKMIDTVPITESFDAVIGIYSGGAFIAKRVVEKNKLKDLNYVHSQLWSGCSMFDLVKKVSFFHNDSELLQHKHFEHEEKIDVVGKKILLIDDSTSSGTTMKIWVKKMYELGASEVKTFALFVGDRYQTDYFFRISPVPLIWPWGAEVD